MSAVRDHSALSTQHSALKNLLGLEGLDRPTLNRILDLAETFAQMLMRDAAHVRWPDRRASRKSPPEFATTNRANPVTQFTG